MDAAQQVGQTLTKNISCYIFWQDAEIFPDISRSRVLMSNFDVKDYSVFAEYGRHGFDSPGIDLSRCILSEYEKFA
ncbi:hypothetical protein [Paraburkholderia sp.]|uniref:hypothetical protein n=1 Tax=Paraburkholderia sp. TaxID=1926495 RepID=UPI002D64A94E|nr:hypothetical protein [Paraburkholderia sp.]HZZ04578.1 hypothetical protein [Paraburkholderia sp.]